MNSIFFLTHFTKKLPHDFIAIIIRSWIQNELYFSNHVFILFNFVTLYLKTPISATHLIPPSV